MFLCYHDLSVPIFSRYIVYDSYKSCPHGSVNKTQHWVHLTHYQTKSFRLFRIERLCSNNFNFDENGRKLSVQVENTVGKGEIAHYEQFLLFPQCFQKACFLGASKGVIVWEWVKYFTKVLSILSKTNSKYKPCQI